MTKEQVLQAKLTRIEKYAKVVEGIAIEGSIINKLGVVVLPAEQFKQHIEALDELLGDIKGEHKLPFEED